MMNNPRGTVSILRKPVSLEGRIECSISRGESGGRPLPAPTLRHLILLMEGINMSLQEPHLLTLTT